jgi:hypothetical protein
MSANDRVRQASKNDTHDQIGDPLSPFPKTDEAARFLRFDTPHLFRKWAQRQRIRIATPIDTRPWRPDV